MRRTLSLPLHHHRTARWQPPAGTGRSPLCHHEAQCCWKAVSGSRWGTMSEKWSNGREELFNELFGWVLFSRMCSSAGDLLFHSLSNAMAETPHFSAAPHSQENTNLSLRGWYLQFHHFLVRPHKSLKAYQYMTTSLCRQTSVLKLEESCWFRRAGSC